MSFSNKIQKYFTNLFISIIEESDSYKLYCKVVKNNKIKDKFDKTFEITKDGDILSEDMENYLISLQNKYNTTYITLLLNSMGQGAIKGVSSEDFKKASVHLESVKTVKFKTWSCYVSYIDINWIQKIYTNVGLDFVYSPFVVLYHKLLEYKLKHKPTLYILNQEDSIAVAVFKEDTLCFGAFYKINKDVELGGSIDVEDWEQEEEESDVGGMVSLDKLNDDELLNLDDFAELGAIDSEINDEELTNFQDEGDTSDLSELESEDVNLDDIELYGRDLEVFKFLKKALQEYYRNDIFDSDFIEDAVIFDGYDMSTEMVEGMENELMLNLKIYKIDIAETVCDLSIKEVYGEL